MAYAKPQGHPEVKLALSAIQFHPFFPRILHISIRSPRLHAVAGADPGAIARVVERFQNLNIVLRRLTAEFSSNDLLYIEVDVCGVPNKQLALIACKIRQATSIVNAYWHRLD
jgi:hypothetical protein